MPTETKLLHKHNPVAANWFELLITPAEEPAGFYTEVSGLTVEIETMTYNEGGRNHAVHKLPTRMKHPNLVLKRGITLASDLQKWVEDSYMGPNGREITLVMYESPYDKTIVRTWKFQNAFPVKWTGPSFNLPSSAVATEALEIVHDGIWVA